MANSALGSQTFTALALPSGVMMDYAGTSAPTGWLMCDGRAVLRSAYPELFLSIGTSYGIGDGVTTFNLPDFRGRFTRYNDNMGTVAGAAGRDTGRVHGSAQGQATAKNGMNAASSSPSTSASTSTSSQGAHGHNWSIFGYDYAWEGINSRPVPQATYADLAIGRFGSGFSGPHDIATSSATPSISTSTSTSTSTTTTTTLTGDTETRPINLSCNKIIKI